MRILLGLLIAVIACLMAFPAQAGSFGLSPAAIALQMDQGTSKTVQFMVIGYDGLVEISSENMPVSVSPSSITAKAGSSITVTVKCNSNATMGRYDGRIVLLAKNGNSVMSGIKVRCNLTVGNPSPSSPIIGGGSSPSGMSGPAVPSGSSSTGGSSAVTGVTSSNSAIPPLSPSVSSNIQNQGKGASSVQTAESNFNYVTFGAIVISGLLLIVLGYLGYRWVVSRRKI